MYSCLPQMSPHVTISCSQSAKTKTRSLNLWRRRSIWKCIFQISCRKCTCGLAPTWNMIWCCCSVTASHVRLWLPNLQLSSTIISYKNERFWNIATDPQFTSSQLQESSEGWSEEGARWGNSRSLIAHRRAASPRERGEGGWEREREREREVGSIPWNINSQRALARHNCWPRSALLGVVTNEINKVCQTSWEGFNSSVFHAEGR